MSMSVVLPVFGAALTISPFLYFYYRAMKKKRNEEMALENILATQANYNGNPADHNNPNERPPPCLSQTEISTYSAVKLSDLLNHPTTKQNHVYINIIEKDLNLNQDNIQKHASSTPSESLSTGTSISTRTDVDTTSSTALSPNHSQSNAAGISDLNSQAISADCLVCFDQLGSDSHVRVIPCGHIFHKNCLDTWLTTRSTMCPTCRFDLKPNSNSTIKTSIVDAPKLLLHRLVSSLKSQRAITADTSTSTIPNTQSSA